MPQDDEFILRDWHRIANTRPRSTPPTFPRERQARWDRAHLFTVGCRLTKYEADQFNYLCAQFNTTKNAVLHSMIMAWIAEHMTEDSPNEYD